MASMDDLSFGDSHPSISTHSERDEYYSQGLRRRFKIDALRTADHQQEGESADIGYEVDEAKYRRRVEARLLANDLPTTVPAGWPTKVSGPLVWGGDDFPDETEYVYQLTDADKAEIALALDHFKEMGLDGSDVSRSKFPLPNLGSQLDKICKDVYQGRGFAIVRGLDVDAFKPDDLAIIYIGVSSYVAERRGKQDQRGSMLLHVIKRNDEDDGQYSEDKPFHTDTVTDCLCLFTKSLAEVGGRSVLASAWTVYNELAATRPDLIHVLAQPDWPFDTFGRNPPFYKRAPLYYYDEKLIMSFSRRLLVGHLPSEPRSAGIPGLTEAQAEALDAVHFIALKHEFKPRMMKGDLRFINNMGILHRREAFENSAGHYRHLVRLWLHNEKMCWKLPDALRIGWARVFEDDERPSHLDIEPVLENGKVVRATGSCD